MERLLLITRHAEAGWENGPDTDHARTLTTRGERQAQALGALLARRQWGPQRLICSTATRAAHTAELVRQALGLEQAAAQVQALYAGGMAALQDAVGPLPASVSRVMVVGHNPTMSHVASQLAGRRLSLMTASCAALRATAPSWEEALDGDWTLDALLRPADDGAA